MNKYTRKIYIRLTEEQYQELMPKDGRSIGNEIRHRIFGEPKKVDKGRPKGSDDTRHAYQISFPVNDKEYEAIKNRVNGQPIGPCLMRIILKRLENVDAEFIDSGYSCGPRNHMVGIRFTREGYEKLLHFVENFGGSMSYCVRYLLFGKE